MTDFRRFFPIAKVDAEQRMVWGYASTEARDDQNEIVTKAALEKALADYMKFANIREMHQPSAVGVAKQAAVDDRGLYVGAKIVDQAAWDKVREGVYKGFSIGGRVTERAAGDSHTITGLDLKEISLVDRPANPEAVFDCWKAADPGEKLAVTETAAIAADPVTTPADTAMAEALKKAGEERTAREAALAAGPVQKWEAVDGSTHLTKTAALKRNHEIVAEEEARAAAAPALAAAAALAAAVAKTADAKKDDDGNDAEMSVKGRDAPGNGRKPYGNVEYADPGYQSDKKKRYPVDTAAHARAAWSYINKPKNERKYSAEDLARVKSKIRAACKRFGIEISEDSGKAGAPDDLQKHLGDVGEIASIILCLRRLKARLGMEAAMEGDDSAAPDKVQAMIEDMCGFLVALVAEETEEVINGDEAPQCWPSPVMCLAAECEDLRKAFGDRYGELVAAAAAGPAINPETAERLAALEKIVTDLGATMQKGAETIEQQAAEIVRLNADLKKLADTPLPPKTVKVPDGYTVVDKNGVADTPAAAPLSTADAERALAALPADLREPIVLAMIQASLKQPVNLMRRG